MGRTVVATVTLTLLLLLYGLAGCAAPPAYTTLDPATPVNIPDASLKAGILKTMQMDRDQITAGEMRKLTELTIYAANPPIQNLSGLEYATNLTSLVIYTNAIVNIDPLSKLTNLTYLDLYQNGISDISALKGLINLQTLLLGQNRISNIGSLSNLTAITVLDLGFNEISDICPLTKMTGLTNLSLESNKKIRDISALKGLTKLKVVVMDDSAYNSNPSVVAVLQQNGCELKQTHWVPLQ